MSYTKVKELHIPVLSRERFDPCLEGGFDPVLDPGLDPPGVNVDLGDNITIRHLKVSFCILSHMICKTFPKFDELRLKMNEQ